MKKFIRLLGIIAFVALIGFSMTACDDNGGGGGGGRISGTYRSSSTNWSYYTFSGNNYVHGSMGVPLWEGTFTVSGNTITLYFDNGVVRDTLTIVNSTTIREANGFEYKKR
jgi:hypothetical protein